MAEIVESVVVRKVPATIKPRVGRSRWLGERAVGSKPSSLLCWGAIGEREGLSSRNLKLLVGWLEHKNKNKPLWRGVEPRSPA